MKRFDPKQQLEKYGWKGGSGLGRDEQGISEAIKAKIKTDTAGVGHNASDEFTFQWWDHVFNKAAKNIKVNDEEGEVSVSKTGHCHVTNKKINARTFADKSTLYGRFVKGSTLLNDGNQVKDSSSESEMEEEDDSGTTSKLTDEAIFKICGGRTAHKGARHGLGATGKLQRVAQQDQLYSGANDTHNSNTESGKHKKKKKKKEKNRSYDDNNEQTMKVTDVSDNKIFSERKKKNEVEIIPNDDCWKAKTNTVKKKSKNKVLRQESIADDIDPDVCAKKRRKKSRKQVDMLVDNEDFDLNVVEQVIKPKRRKKNSNEKESEAEIEKCSPTSCLKRTSYERLQDDELETNTVKRKKKKKRKKREVKIVD